MKSRLTFGVAVLIWLFTIPAARSQQKWWVFFCDKSGSTFDACLPSDPHTIARRLRSCAPLRDSSDLPLNQAYVARVAALADSLGHASRWLNAQAVWADESDIPRIRALPFVRRVTKMSMCIPLAASTCDDVPFSGDYFYLLHHQTERMQGALLRQQGLTGKGVRIAVFDGGFRGVETSPCFARLRDNGQIIGTRDFVRNRDQVDGFSTHGTMVLSCIGGMADTMHMGLAPDAEFLLARVEKFSQPFYLEDNWIAAIEWAEEHGADIISSSMGYSTGRYFIEDMDGVTPFVSRAANMAAAKGILLISSMGNEAGNTWGVLTAPADADSVLAVGAIDPYTDYHADFSSFGPTSDKRLKPNVSAVGTAIVATPKQTTSSSGTSFSTPLVAGFAACAWQADSALSNMELFRLLEKSGDLYPYHDYAHGYGVPVASRLLGKESSIADTFGIFTISVFDDTLSVRVWEKRIPPEHSYTVHPDLVYVQFSDSEAICRFLVIRHYYPLVGRFALREIGGFEMRIFWRGVYGSFLIPDAEEQDIEEYEEMEEE